jgi:hypothetical protein
MGSRTPEPLQPRPVCRKTRSFMTQGKRSRELGLEICVVRADTSGGNSNCYPEEELDSDGHHIFYEMVVMKGQRILSLELRQGMAPGAAANLLRKIANSLDRHGAKLLGMPRGGEGYFDSKGEPQADPLQVERDEHGNLAPPDIL